MKVLDLQCGAGHAFEGWFASEDDFLAQRDKAMVQCPLCGDAQISKKLSAPRLNLLAKRPSHEPPVDVATPVAASQEQTAAWMQVARAIVANTQDVGDQFAEVARKMHYGETEERAIRGKTTPEQARSLVDEGIEILPFALPESFKEPLQ